MTHTISLALGDPHYSSWSMRAGLVVLHWDLPVELSFARMRDPAFEELMAKFAPARTVPALKLSSGQVVRDSLAIIETLTELFPNHPIWPEAQAQRAEARSLTAEMHSGFATLRRLCPMNLRQAYQHPGNDADLAADLKRLRHIWDHALQRSSGPWLCGAYSAVDAFYAPVAMRLLGYGLDMAPFMRSYALQHLNHAAFQKWYALGEDWADQTVYDQPWPKLAWPQA